MREIVSRAGGSGSEGPPHLVVFSYVPVDEMPAGSAALWQRINDTCKALDKFAHKGIVGVPPAGASIDDFRDPGRALQLKSGWYVPAGVDVPISANVSCSASKTMGPKRGGHAQSGQCGGINWFRATNDSMAQLEHTGFLLTSHAIGMMECPDVFELNGKVGIWSTHQLTFTLTLTRTQTLTQSLILTLTCTLIGGGRAGGCRGVHSILGRSDE